MTLPPHHILREDGQRVEWICPHGVGHPVKHLCRDWQDWMDVHGCDGCCFKAEHGMIFVDPESVK